MQYHLIIGEQLLSIHSLLANKKSQESNGLQQSVSVMENSKHKIVTKKIVTNAFSADILGVDHAFSANKQQQNGNDDGM